MGQSPAEVATAGETARGGWPVLDALRGYRICRYNHARLGGTHAHHPANEPPLAAVDLATVQEAEAVIRRYHERYDYGRDELLHAAGNEILITV